MKIFKITSFVFCVLFCFSCYKENDIVELSTYDDFMMEVTVFFDPDHLGERFEYEVVDYYTNGYNELISFPTNIGGTYSYSYRLKKTSYYIVKEYKTVGVKIRPIKNITAYRFKIFEINLELNPYSKVVLEIENEINNETTILYDFETESVSIEEN